MSGHEEFLQSKILPWGERSPNVRGLAELGSRAHDSPADEWADMDLLILARDPKPLLNSDGWIDEIGVAWLALRHPGPFPELPVRQVLFEGALDFDVIPVEAGTLSLLLGKSWVRELIGAGIRTLLDKDEELTSIDDEVFTDSIEAVPAVDETEYDFVVRDFLFQIVWAAKHLRRGELWAAKDDVDCYMRGRLAQMIEWHTWGHDGEALTRAGGRYIERWAATPILDDLPSTFASYDAIGVARSLLTSAQLFRRVAEETGSTFGFTYPVEAHQKVLGWAERCLGPILRE